MPTHVLLIIAVGTAIAAIALVLFARRNSARARQRLTQAPALAPLPQADRLAEPVFTLDPLVLADGPAVEAQDDERLPEPEPINSELIWQDTQFQIDTAVRIETERLAAEAARMEEEAILAEAQAEQARIFSQMQDVENISWDGILPVGGRFQPEAIDEPHLPAPLPRIVVDSRLDQTESDSVATRKEKAAQVKSARAAARRTETARRIAEDAQRQEAERQAAEVAKRREIERVATEETWLEAGAAAAEEAARLEAERIAAARVHAARLETQRRAALEQERAHALKMDAEKAANQEAARLAAEEAIRIKAALLLAEEAAREEAARQAVLAAEKAQAERVAAEEEARLAAERAVAAEAARIEAQRLSAVEAKWIAAAAVRTAAEEKKRKQKEEASQAAARRFAALAAQPLPDSSGNGDQNSPTETPSPADPSVKRTPST